MIIEPQQISILCREKRSIIKNNITYDKKDCKYYNIIVFLTYNIAFLKAFY